MSPTLMPDLHNKPALSSGYCRNGISFFTVFLLTVFILGLISPVLGGPGTETLISVNTTLTSQSDPSVYGNWIVWTDARSGSTQVYGYNVVTGEETRISPPLAVASQPDIYGNQVVWRDGRDGNYDIFVYSMNTATEAQVTTNTAAQELPAISGDLIVWEDARNGFSDIYLYNLHSSQEFLLTPGTTNSDQKNPAISGTKVVWQDSRNYYDTNPFYAGLEGYYSDILMNDTATWGLTNVSHDFLDPGYDEFTPAISTDNVVWEDDRYGEKGDIYLNDTGSGTQAAVTESNSWFKILPDIDGNNVIWLDNRDRVGYVYDIYFKDITTLPAGLDTRITGPEATIVSSGKGPKISGNRIVWTDYRNGNNDIYMYTLGSDETCPVAGFTMSTQSGPAPLTVDFTDTSAAGTTAISHRKWEFGDGNSTTDTLNPSWTYTVPGTYNVRLTVNNPLCRNETPVSTTYRVSTGTAPVASFSTNATSGMVPLAIRFTDSSLAATAWNWSFGDGTYSALQNPVHTYSSGGTYTVLLNASNSYGYSASTATIQGLTGANENADTTISGIGIDSRYGGQFLVFDGTALAGYSNPSPGVLVSPPLLSDGWQNITFVTLDSGGFHDFGNGTLMGNISSVILQTKEISPAGFSNRIGALSSVNYSVTLSGYPENAVLNTQIWEGYTADDLSAFRTIASSAGYTYLWDVAYTTKVTKTNFPQGGTGRFRMCVNRSWITAYTDRDHIFVERISDDRSTGEVLTARFLATDPAKDLDYFEIDSPHGLSSFGLTQLSGSGNPLQLITLTVASHVSSPASPGSSDNPGGSGSDSESSSGGSGTKSSGTSPNSQLAPMEQQQAPEVPGVTGTVYTDANGIVTQATSLVSTDNRATVSFPAGTMARDVQGNPLSTVTLTASPSGAISSSPPGSAVTFEGVAYNLGPDGAVFSPSISLTFTVPQASLGKDYTVRTYDQKSGTWQDLPTTFDPATGTVTAQVSHFCCFGLFSKIPRSAPVQTPAPVQPSTTEAQAPQAPPTTAVSIFSSMMVWAGNLLVANSTVAIISALAFAGIGGVWYLRYRRR